MSEPYGEQPAVPWTSQKVASKKCVFLGGRCFVEHIAGKDQFNQVNYPDYHIDQTSLSEDFVVLGQKPVKASTRFFLGLDEKDADKFEEERLS